MPTYSRPRMPRPTSARVARPAPGAGADTGTGTGSAPVGGTMESYMPQPRLRNLATTQAQGRDVVSRGGQQGVVGGGGNFQPLGRAALSRLAEGGGSGVGSMPATGHSFRSWEGGAVPDFARIAGFPAPGVGSSAPGGAPVPADGGDIQTAIRGLKSQLGEPSDAVRAAGMGPALSSMPTPNANPAGVSPDVTSRLKSLVGYGIQSPTEQGQALAPDAAGVAANLSQLAGRQPTNAAGNTRPYGGIVSEFANGGNPYVNLLRQRALPAAVTNAYGGMR